MRKRKILSIVLSLALVFSMISAFTVATYAGGEGTSENSKTPLGVYVEKPVDTVYVNGISLTDGQYIKADSTSAQTGIHPLSGYAYYKNGTLTLNNFVLEDISGHPGIKAEKSENSTYNSLDIVLKGKNSITMKDVENDSDEYPAIDAGDLDLTISEGSLGASLNLKSNDGSTKKDEHNKDQYIPVSCIAAGSFEFESGSLTISAGKNHGTYFYDYNETWKIYFSQKEIYDAAIFVRERDAKISGGNLNITNAGCAICANECVYVNGGETTIGVKDSEDSTISGTALYTDTKSVVITDGSINIYNVGSNGIYAYNTVNIQGGSVVIDGSDNYGIRTIYEDVILNNGSVNINDTNNNAINAEGEISIINSKVKVNNAGVEKGINGIFGQSSCDISNSTVSIANVGYHGIYVFSGISISDSVVTITAPENAINSDTNITVKNSDVSALSTGDTNSDVAFSPTVTITGNPVVYAGSTQLTAHKVTNLKNLSNYQYVHIYKDGVTPQTGFAGIFTKLFTWLKTFNTGTSFTISPIWKIFSTIFKLN